MIYQLKSFLSYPNVLKYLSRHDMIQTAFVKSLVNELGHKLRGNEIGPELNIARNNTV